MMTSKKVRHWRRLAEAAQGVVIIGLPFVRIKGESALRFDIPSLQLHFFGLTLWMEEFFIVLIGTVFFSLFIVFITLVLGRIWCGWLCPQTVIADLTSFAGKGRTKGVSGRLISYTAVLLVSIVVAANLIWYFVSPYDFIPRLFGGNLGNIIWGFWAVLTIILFLNFIWLRQKFCATVCPYAKLQSTLFDDRTLAVAFDKRREEECMDCEACVKVCPVGIDIRKGLDIACIHCAECRDTCADMMGARKKTSLIGYFFGLPGEGGTLLRQNALLTGTLALAFLLFFFYLLYVRTPIDMTVLPNQSFQPRINSRGAVINSYIITLKNRGRIDAELITGVTGIGGSVKVVPDRALSLKAGEMKRFTMYVYVEGVDDRTLAQEAEIVISSSGGDGLSTEEKINFIIPEKQ